MSPFRKRDLPFIANDLLEAVHHARVVILARDWDLALDLPAPSLFLTFCRLFQCFGLHSCLDHIERVHDQDLGHTSDRAGGELVDELNTLDRRLIMFPWREESLSAATEARIEGANSNG